MASVKYDLFVESDRIDEETMLVTVARFPGKGCKETFLRSVDVVITDHVSRYPDASEEDRHCVAEAIGLSWMLVYGGMVPYETDDQHHKPGSGKDFRFQFLHPAGLVDEINRVESFDSGYNVHHPLGTVAALFHDRYAGATIEAVDAEHKGIADDVDVHLDHYDDQKVWVRNRVDEMIAGTEWGTVSLRHTALHKAYRHHKAIETGRGRKEFIASSPFRFLTTLLVNNRFDPLDNQADYDFILERWFEREEVQDASVWTIRNPGSPAMKDWLITVTTELLSGTEKTIIRDVNRFSPEVRYKLREEWYQSAGG